MHYRINSLVIKTENAAKPVSRGSRWVLDWILARPKTHIGMDYGCGKFRYTIPLSRQVRFVHAVDSIHQVGRTQVIGDRRSNLRSFATKYLKNVRVHEVSSPSWRRVRTDFALCANVLSAIPSTQERIQVLVNIRSILKAGGHLLACTQFRNTDFSSYGVRPDAIRFRDGWVLAGRHGASFYGIIPPESLAALCSAAGFSIADYRSKGESAYVLALRP